jgi:hypothetical protein
MATFDPNSITPSADVLTSWCFSEAGLILAARWGAAKAAEALRHQWPEPITDRPPTEKDGDGNGLVQYLWFDKWNYGGWNHVATKGYCWLHTPRWCPKPEPTLKQQAIEILDTVFPSAGCTLEQALQAETLRVALDLIPEGDAG